MKHAWIVAASFACAGLAAAAGATDAPTASTAGKSTRLVPSAVALERAFFARLDLRTSRLEAEARLRRDPEDMMALFVRMETAELEERPDQVLDSALRLCRTNVPADVQDVASSRILEYAANSRVFISALSQIQAAGGKNDRCAFNLRLALVAAAADGATMLDLDQAAISAGLLTHWRIAGPFGRYGNVDFERPWPPGLDGVSQSAYATAITERFWFRDGTIALPDYLTGPGVLYAATEVEASAGPLRLDVFSAGAYAVFVDDRLLLIHDPSSVASPPNDSVPLRLGPGKHRVVLKFTSAAAPLRLALHAEFAAATSLLPAAPGQPLHEYAAALVLYLHDDFIGMARLLSSDSCPHSGACLYLRALLYSGVEGHSPLALTAWKAVAKAAPSASLARVNTLAAGPDDEASSDLSQVASIARQNPLSETAWHLAFRLSRRNPTEATDFLQRLLDFHPSCTHLVEALEFHNSAGELDRAQRVEKQLAVCAPDSLDYAHALSDSGRHGAAAAYLQQIVSANPLHRPARRLLVEQLVLDKQLDAARIQAQGLHEVAPNSADFLRLAGDPNTVLDTHIPSSEGFARREEFYVPYQRDGLDLIRKSARREFSGGSAVIILFDKVIRVRHNGSISVYVHRITRLLNKDGIAGYGEVAVPPGAALLELRTVKTTGQIVEPELGLEPTEISMPGLEPGDSIEEEFVSHYSGWEQVPENASIFEFGSFAAPVLSSRLTVIAPAGEEIVFSARNGAPAERTERTKDNVVHHWQRDNIAQTATEAFLPDGGLLPAVTISPATDTGDRLRDQLLNSTRLGRQAALAMLSLHLPPAAGDFETARNLAHFVARNIEPAESDWTANSANDTLVNSQGSRTLALLALARASGLNVGLILAHEIEHPCTGDASLLCYTQPLVRFWLGGATVDVDAEANNLPFGVVPAALDPRNALLIPLAAGSREQPGFVSLAVNLEQEKTVAEGDLTLNNEGDLAASVHVRLGATRAQEVRRQLRGAGSRERQVFFEQFARRIIPDGTNVTGSVLHENDPEHSLEVMLHWVVPQFANLRSGVAEIDQLAPALGLRNTYARLATRRFPLYTESLFFESAVFRLHLPAGVEVRSLPAEFSTKTEFGDYAARFTQSAQQIEIRREFRVPVQVVAPEKYPAFDEFARQIDAAERQRISLQWTARAATVPDNSRPLQITRK